MILFFAMGITQNTLAVKLCERLGFRIIEILPEAVRNPSGSYQDGYVVHRKLGNLSSSDFFGPFGFFKTYESKIISNQERTLNKHALLIEQCKSLINVQILQFFFQLHFFI